ncbi:hypothetical protein BDW68DRAFT_14412 [Aspergillus falconensis]
MHYLPLIFRLRGVQSPAGVSFSLFPLPISSASNIHAARAHPKTPEACGPILQDCWPPVTVSNRSLCLAALERKGPSSEVRLLGRRRFRPLWVQWSNTGIGHLAVLNFSGYQSRARILGWSVGALIQSYSVLCAP